MLKAAKILTFVVAALATLLAGCFALIFTSNMVDSYLGRDSRVPHSPGIYSGHVTASFNSLDGYYHLRFRGETPTRWRWNPRTNFVYKRLEINWWGAGAGDSAVVNLPSLAYQSHGSTGLLSQATLAGWLLETDPGQNRTNDTEALEKIFSYVRAAGHGSLPAPSHHTHGLKEQPVRGVIFTGCTGVPWFILLWFVVWLYLAVGIAVNISRGHRKAALDLSHPHVVALSKQLQTLHAMPITTDEERAAWCAKAGEFRKQLYEDWKDIYPSLPHEIEHYLDDVDIRAKDPAYAGHQAGLLSDLLSLPT